MLCIISSFPFPDADGKKKIFSCEPIFTPSKSNKICKELLDSGTNETGRMDSYKIMFNKGKNSTLCYP